MSLNANWADTTAYKNPIILDPNHAMFDEIDVNRSQHWYLDEEDGQINCQNPLIEKFIFLCATFGLNGGYDTPLPKVSRSLHNRGSITEWVFRLQYACGTGYLSECKPLRVQHWTAEGWAFRDIVIDDITSLVGLSTNVSNITRKQFVKNVNTYNVDWFDKLSKELVKKNNTTNSLANDSGFKNYPKYSWI